MKSTDELLKILKNYNNIEEFIEDNTEDIKNTTFVQYITECLNNCNLTKAQVIEKSNIQKNYAYQIFSGSKKPSRNKVLALSISMGLDTDATNRL